MSLNKYQSTTSDTRITGSFNQSLVGAGHQKLAQQVMQSQQCQIMFLRRKNGQLQERVARLTTEVSVLEKNKAELLVLNQKYVKIVNEYYRKLAPSGKENRRGNSILLELEKDHRNLVKHCLNMQEEIKNYSKQMEKFNEMKQHLQSVNHSNTKELIEELQCLTEENKALKMQNNKLEFELMKSKQECNRLKKGKEQCQDKADQEGDQLERYKSLVNTVQQQSTDKSNAYESKIYELEIKVQKLQKQLREGQDFVIKSKELQRKLQMAEVEHIHEKDKYRLSLREKKAHSRVKQSFSFVQ